MTILTNSPVLALIFFLLLWLLIVVNSHAYGISKNLNQVIRLLAKKEQNILIIDIREKSRFDDYHIQDSVHASDIKNLQKIGSIEGRILIIHDSNIDIQNFFKANNIKNFNKNIYQSNVLYWGIRHYQPQNSGIFIGKFGSDFK